MSFLSQRNNEHLDFHEYILQFTVYYYIIIQYG